MINAKIHEDFFFLASVPMKQAQALCPTGVAPVSIGELGWLAISVVKLSQVTFFGLPVSDQPICAGLLLIVEYGDREGRLRRGNLFVRGYTTSRPLAWLDAILRLDVFHLLPMSIECRGLSVVVTIPGEFVAQVDVSKQAKGGTSCEELFADNHSAVVKLGRSAWYLQLRKAHWRLQRRIVEVIDGSIFTSHGATMECCFDTSESCGSWGLPGRVSRFNFIRARRSR